MGSGNLACIKTTNLKRGDMEGLAPKGKTKKRKDAQKGGKEMDGKNTLGKKGGEELRGWAPKI